MLEEDDFLKVKIQELVDVYILSKVVVAIEIVVKNYSKAIDFKIVFENEVDFNVGNQKVLANVEKVIYAKEKVDF